MPVKKILLMSSMEFFVEKAQALFDHPLQEERIAYITTASKGDNHYAHALDRMEQMREKGYQFEEVDIMGKTEAQLRSLLENTTLILVGGGNTFYLLKAVKESRFDVVVKELIQKGVVYAGSSAGAYIACPTIEAATWGDADSNNVGITDLTAMNLVPFLIVAHYVPEDKEHIAESTKAAKYQVQILTDEQALWVEGDRLTRIE